MEKPAEMTTLTRVLEKLREKGFDDEFKMTDHGKMQSPKTGKLYDPEDLIIIKTYRFEGESDPSDSSVVYVLEDGEGQKGYLLDAFGAYSNHEGDGFDDFLKKLKVEDRDEQILYQ